MAESPDPPAKYTVDRLPAVTQQIRRFAARAKELGSGRQILDVLESIISKLETDPLDWGDPEYATKQSGGLVLHGIDFPFFVQYVLFQQHRLACILKIKALPGHPLESG